MLLTGAECAVKVYNGTYEPYFARVCVRYGVRHVQPKWCTLRRVCVNVCVYGGRQVQPEPCTNRRREYVCICAYGVRHVQTEWCTFRAEVCPCMLAQCSMYAVRAVYLLRVLCAVYPLHASGVERTPRTCMCTMFGMGFPSDAPIVHECACVDVYPVRQRAQCLAWAA